MVWLTPRFYCYRQRRQATHQSTYDATAEQTYTTGNNKNAKNYHCCATRGNYCLLFLLCCPYFYYLLLLYNSPALTRTHTRTYAVTPILNLFFTTKQEVPDRSGQKYLDKFSKTLRSLDETPEISPTDEEVKAYLLCVVL